MKKTTVRFIAVGAVLLLGALALALAQHDARQRPREQVASSKLPIEQPQPIPMDDNPLWGHPKASSTARTIVRANDDRTSDELSSAPPSIDFSAAPTSLEASGSLNDEADLNAAPPSPLSAFDLPANPLRSASGSMNDNSASTDNNLPPSFEAQTLGTLDDRSRVRQAAGEGPPTGPVVPPATPSLRAAPLPVATPSTMPGDGDVIKSPPPGWLQSPPTLPNSTPPVSVPSVSMPAASSQPMNTRLPTTSSTDNVRPGNAMPGNVLGNLPNNLPSTSSAGSQSPPGLSNMPNMPSASGIGATSPAATLGSPQPTAMRDGSNLNSGFNSLGGSAVGARAPLAGTAVGTLVSNQPGNQHLLGSQNPVMLIQKRMAGECQVGKRASVVIAVRNAGNSTAQDVEVIDSVPNGASFADEIPAVTPTADGILLWKLGEMGPGDERTINLQIVPERQGEMGSTAVVRFAAQASMRTLATLPKLELTFTAAPEVLIGSAHAVNVNVKNVGTGVAKSVVLEADIPGNLKHETGDVILQAEFGDIAPGESKIIRLNTLAAEPGPASLALRALTEDGVQQEQKVDLRVMAPALEAVITGPNRRYLDRQATFAIMIKNTGSAPATNCEFMIRLPAGLNFNTANKEGRYDAQQHAVLWSVPEFPAGHAEPVELTVLPVEVGTQQMTFQGSADLGIKTEARGTVLVEEQGELTFTIDQDADPIEITSSTTYTVEVRNVGRGDRNIELSLQLPAGSEVLKVDAPVQARVDGDQLRFDPIPQMEGRTSQKFRIEVRHGKVGVQVVRAQLRSQNRPTLVVKEEATEVYNDRE